MSKRVSVRVWLWLSVQFAVCCCRVRGHCSSENDINSWLTSGICVRSEKDMTDCGSKVSNIFVPDEVRKNTAIM